MNSEPESTCALCCFLSGLLGTVMLKLSNKDPIAILAALLILGTIGPFLSVSLTLLDMWTKDPLLFPLMSDGWIVLEEPPCLQA